MKRITVCLILVLSAQQRVDAQVITLGTGVNAFSIDFVQIGNPGNAADTSGSPNPAGSVSYIYSIGKYEISREMIDKANLIANLGITLADMTSYGGNGAKKPATGIGWYEAARFVNYLNESFGRQAAYKFDANGNFQMWSPTDAGYNGNNQFRNNLAMFFLPSSHEWYKAAYGSPSGTWYKYPTGSNTAPRAVVSGTDPNTAVLPLISSPPNYSADIDQAGGLSAWGTMAQGGNTWEWTESAFDGINDSVSENREVRGGSAGSAGGPDFSSLMSTVRYDDTILREPNDLGFRVAMIPEPSAVSLLAIGLGALAMMRRLRS